MAVIIKTVKLLKSDQDEIKIDDNKEVIFPMDVTRNQDLTGSMEKEQVRFAQKTEHQNLK